MRSTKNFIWENKLYKERKKKASENLSTSPKNSKSDAQMFFIIQEVHLGKVTLSLRLIFKSKKTILLLFFKS